MTNEAKRNEDMAEPLVGNLAEAREIIEAFAQTDPGDSVGSVSCNLKTHRDYPRSWAVDAAKAWLIANAHADGRGDSPRTVRREVGAQP